jgi:hypothetical protein
MPISLLGASGDPAAQVAPTRPSPSICDAISRLRGLALRLIEREDPDAAWFARSLSLYEGGDTSFDAAFGLPAPARYRSGMARRQRDALLVEMASRFFAAESNRQRALKIGKTIRRFAGGSQRWRPGEISELCAYVLRVCPPPSVRTVERALSGTVPTVGTVIRGGEALSGAPSSPPFGARNGIHLDHEDSLHTVR